MAADSPDLQQPHCTFFFPIFREPASTFCFVFRSDTGSHSVAADRKTQDAWQGCCHVLLYHRRRLNTPCMCPFESPSKRKQAALSLSPINLDVTVTRREDATFAPNGYIYNVYFDGAEDATNVPQLELVPSDGCTQFNPPAESVAVATITEGTTAGGVFSDTQLPLGDIDDSSLEGT